jgi:hypothetical protein
MMTCAECDEALLDYFEAQLGETKHSAVEAHVSSCARCQGLVRDVNGIRAGAAALPDLAPSRDLWKGIEARIQPSVTSIASPRQHAVMPRAWMAAAAAALIVVSSSVTYVATKSTAVKPKPSTGSSAATVTPVRVSGATIEAAPEVQPEIPASPTPRAGETRSRSVTAPVPARISTQGNTTLASSTPALRTESEIAIADEIGRLQTMLRERRAGMAPETVKVVEDNLAIIEAAVEQARAAVARDPGSGFLTERLERALQKKVQLLRTVALLPSST